MIKTNTTAALETECGDTLERLTQSNKRVAEPFSYFTELTSRRFRQTGGDAPAVTILGADFPEELILAAGAPHCRFIGGSLRSCDMSDDAVPRDTDPNSRSILGEILNPNGPDMSNTLFIVPLSCDSMRKTAYLLKQYGHDVCTVDIPPQRRDPWSKKQWERELKRVTDTVSAHTHTHVTARRLSDAIDVAEAARREMQRFLKLSNDREDLITAAGRILVQNSYYCADDLREWRYRLKALNAQLRADSRRYAPRHQNRPGVVIFGSPICFPNYKVPFLLEDAGLRVTENVDPAALKLRRPPMAQRPRRFDDLLGAVADHSFRYDASPAFTSNDVLYSYLAACLQSDWTEGIVCHVLKGQVEYDFELDRIEALADRYGVPVFRLETDYQYQDVEQLRIRIEAFSEMLRHNRLRRERAAQ